MQGGEGFQGSKYPIREAPQLVVIEGQKDHILLVLEKPLGETADVVLVQQYHLEIREPSKNRLWKTRKLVVVKNQRCELSVVCESL
jgi:hypothetical protein